MAKRVVVGAVILLVLVGLGYCDVQPPDYHQYRKTANQAAQAALGAVRTTALTVGALLEHRVTGPYTAVVVDAAVSSVASANQQVTQLAPPDQATTAMRAQLTPLLGDAARELGDVSTALDEGAPDRIRAAARGLGALGDRLDGYLEEHG
jgi:hypothetical protein